MYNNKLNVVLLKVLVCEVFFDFVRFIKFWNKRRKKYILILCNIDWNIIFL